MQVYNKPNIIAASTRMNTTINSTPCQLKNMFGDSIEVVFTGTPTGSFKLQASNDPNDQIDPTTFLPGPVNWTDVAGSSQSVAAAGNVMWNVTDVMYNFVRVVYTDTSSGASTATITVSTFNGKGV